jgi:hypothetical protein
MALNEYQPGTTFTGVIGRTTDESTPAWPRPVRTMPGAPNVLMIVLDDTGYGQLGCYGSPIATPDIDALAAGGLLYTNMHTTALCSPSRSCIVTGRNHHANAMAAITEISTGYPGYNAHIPFENGMLSEMLLQHGATHAPHQVAKEWADRYRGRFDDEGSPGRAQLYVDGTLVGQIVIPVTTPVTFNPGGMTCGANPGAPVTSDYRSPFSFTGTLHRVTVDLSGDLIIDPESEMRLAMTRQ